MKKKIAIFASGGGSNAKAILQYAKKSNYEVDLIVSNKEDAGVLLHAQNFDVDALIIDKENFYEDNIIVDFLSERKIEAIVLAGFLWLVPPYLIDAFPDKIINIHPSLLPKYGGKGMYGIKVHQAVFDAKEKESGITIHLVNKEYDKGEILFQEKVKLSEKDSPKQIAAKVLKIEHQFFPKVIDKFLANS